MNENMEVYHGGQVYKKPLLGKPLVMSSKKPLLCHPNEAAPHHMKPLLHGVTTKRPLGVTPWPGGENTSYDNDETFTHAYPPATKRQALLPIPGEWKADPEQTWTDGLLPCPIIESPPSCGLLPPPTSWSPHMYTPPPPHYISPPLPSPDFTPEVPPTPGLLPSPRHLETGRGIESTKATMKKMPLLPTPSQQGTQFSGPKKPPLLPHAPGTTGGSSQEQARKPPLLPAPPSNGTSAHLQRNGATSQSNDGQQCWPRNERKPLIPTPPVLSSHPSRMGPNSQVSPQSQPGRMGPSTHVSRPSHPSKMGSTAHVSFASHPHKTGPNTHVSHPSYPSKVGPCTHTSYPSCSNRMGPNTHISQPSEPSRPGPCTHVSYPSHPSKMGSNTHISYPSRPSIMGSNTHDSYPSHPSIMGPNSHVPHPSRPSNMGPSTRVSYPHDIHESYPSRPSIMGPNPYVLSPSEPIIMGPNTYGYKEQAANFHQTINIPPRNNRPLLPTPKIH